PSEVILSVSSSKRAWSFLTTSPSWTCHLASTPELMDSPMGGILTSMAMKRGGKLDGEGGAEQAGGLRLVQRERADGGGRRGVAPGVGGLAAESLLEDRGDVGPGAHVLGLLLAPDESRARVLLRDVVQAARVHRIELLDAHDRSVGELVLFP